MLRVSILIISLVLASCHKYYMDEIPNGHQVKHPCKPSEIWQAVGHNDPLDGHSGVNVFGEDFKHHNDQWGRDLCMADSDKDGKTNGQELGDPSCIWTSSGSHNLPAPTGHPGICEPVGSPACSFQKFSCGSTLSGVTSPVSGGHDKDHGKDHDKDHEKDHDKDHDKHHHDKDHDKHHHDKHHHDQDDYIH